VVSFECKARTLTLCLALELNCLRKLRWAKEIMIEMMLGQTVIGHAQSLDVLFSRVPLSRARGRRKYLFEKKKTLSSNKHRTTEQQRGPQLSP